MHISGAAAAVAIPVKRQDLPVPMVYLHEDGAAVYPQRSRDFPRSVDLY